MNEQVLIKFVRSIIPALLVGALTYGFMTQNLLYGIPGALIVFWFLAEPFYSNRTIRQKLWYAVTNQRIIILRVDPTPEIAWIDFDRIRDMKIKESKSGNGAILTTKSHSYSERCDFLYLSQARKVYDVINQAIVAYNQRQAAV